MDIAQAISYTNALTQQNNQWSASQAAEQRRFQREMSNTAHQREVADLKAAGLNPVLSAHNNGASTPAGAMGGTDNSNIGAVVELLKTFGEGIAQATAKGAAKGTATGANPISDIIEAAAGKGASAKQLEIMEKRMADIDKRDEKLAADRKNKKEKNDRLVNSWKAEAGYGLTADDYISNFMTAATMAAPGFSVLAAPALTIPAVVAAAKTLYNNAKSRGKEVSKSKKK